MQHYQETILNVSVDDYTSKFLKDSVSAIPESDSFIHVIYNKTTEAKLAAAVHYFCKTEM